MTDDVDLDQARHQLVQAVTRAQDPDVIRHVDQALAALGVEIETRVCPRCERLTAADRLE